MCDILKALSWTGLIQYEYPALFCTAYEKFGASAWGNSGTAEAMDRMRQAMAAALGRHRRGADEKDDGHFERSSQVKSSQV